MTMRTIEIAIYTGVRAYRSSDDAEYTPEGQIA